MPILVPDLLYVHGRFLPGLAVDCDAATGRIRRVGPTEALVSAGSPETLLAGGPAAELGPDATAAEFLEDRDATERLPGRALLPGFVNAHSHAFQRLIRGRTQWRPADRPEADFWSWREAMYGAAQILSPDDVFHASRFAFLEMLRAGFTSVGEFHYLHRDPSGEPYAEPNELARRVLDAAGEVGIRIALLQVCYAAGGIGRPLGEAQRRFATPDLDGFLAGCEALGRAVEDRPLASLGVAPHSVRAVPRDWLAPLHAWAAQRRRPFHIHASEQRAEVEAALEAYGLRPLALLAEEGVLDARTTAVHATHIDEEEIRLLARSGATVCACPTTERDLGDGFLPGASLLAAGVPVALGSDSQTVIDPLEEMRLLEYHERLRAERRVLLAAPAPDHPDRVEVAGTLLRAGTVAGARSLGLEAGEIRDGALADLVAFDLAHPALAGWTEETLAAMIALSAPPAAIRDVWVAGVRRVEGGRHTLDASAALSFREVAGRLLGDTA